MSYNNNDDNNSNNNNNSKQLGSQWCIRCLTVLCLYLSEDTLVSLIGDFKVAAGLMINGYVSPC